MNGFEHSRYKLFRKVKGVKFGTYYSGVPKMTKKFAEQELYPKREMKWEFADLYYQFDTESN